MRTAAMYRRFARGGRRRGFATVLLALGLIITGLAVIVASHFRPMVLELALSNTTDEITIAVNETVSELMTDGTIDCTGLVTLEKDNSGAITALSTNIAQVNMLQAAVNNAILRRFVEKDVTPVSVPLGNLFGWALLSGRGPRIEVKLLSVTNVQTSFRNEFSAAGINQTRHRILMDVEVSFGILLAGKSAWETVRSEISVADTVIVGAVPDTYAEMGKWETIPTE